MERIEQEEEISISGLFNFLWRLKFWIVFTVALALVGAFFYLKTQDVIYERTSWIRLNGNNSSNDSQFSLLFGADLGGKKALDDEVFILQSPSLMQKVVEKLELNKRFYAAAFKQREFYGNSPFSISLTADPRYPDSMQPAGVRLEFIHNGDSTYTLGNLVVNGIPRKLDASVLPYNRPILLNGLKLTLGLVYADEAIAGERYVATWTEPFAAARSFLSHLSVAVQGAKSNRTDIVALTYKDTSPSRAADILNTLTEVANQEAHKYEMNSAQDALDFISERLVDIAGDLDVAEEGYKEYQSMRALVNDNAQANLTLGSDRQYKDKLTDIILQLEILQMIHKFVVETPPGTYRMVPAYIVVSDAGLNSMISKYNEKVVTRDRMVFNSSADNPKVQSINTELDVSKKGIELSLDNLIRIYTLRQRELERVLDKSRDQIAEIPEHQLQMRQLSRKVEVIEPLYRMLQEKREEIQIALYSSEDTFRVIEPAFGNNSPVAPNRRMTFLLAFLLGFGVCPALWIIRALLRWKVETKADVEKAIDAIVLAVLPRSGARRKYSLIPKDGRDHLSESFRMFRANIEALPEAKVIQVTSSVLGEGKSFVAANLALSLAHIGRKVLLVGMDLRKPALPHIFRCQADSNRSFVAYLGDESRTLEEVIIPSGKSENLDLLISGACPPDPTVLLSSPCTREMLQALRQRYDYVIIDSTPYFPVSDASIVNKYVDTTLFLVRCDYTSLKLLKEVDRVLHREINPIRNAYLVLNDFNAAALKYRFSYDEGYGYDNISSYGYAYGKYGYGRGAKK